MRYLSLNDKNHMAGFKEAVVRGIAPDKGLYFPERIEPLPSSFFDQIENRSKDEIAFQAIQQFVGEDISNNALQNIIAATLDFEFPLVTIEEGIATLELFHGPTMAFKDVGARFMANCLGHFSETSDEEVTVLVATSGDTGGAVANGFLGVEGAKVVILYPSGKVSDIQERQLTTLGQNITAMEVSGTFDDCQRMVKDAFLDVDITKKRKLTSANSINVARWLPQMFYYLFAYRDSKKREMDIVFSVPSGNFGNICAGMVAHRLGMPVKHFVAATNVNDVVPNYMKSAEYSPKPSIATISNAMDVGDPSNFIRIQNLFENSFEKLQRYLSSFSFTDEETKAAMFDVYGKTGYMMDPHGAVGYLGLKKYMENNPGISGIFLETAHPIKFLDVVKETLDVSLDIPPQIQRVIDKEKIAIPIKKYAELKSFLMD
ncbi:threonine synthase [Allomuricauda sp. SCSIO 65647]|uniref:threonine synthase n=1 Tax=Allomuricauda sp. SCSIO 65647 TaxID=2908843 RepID=UPI001F34F645|nr:threonine synthase [Muricauda sp. SCSIO 65647]UJH66972.1 threonine synthase [Muricauda sp. SCSIO 65647]